MENNDPICYLVRSGPLYKIGATRKWSRRLMGLRGHSPLAVEVVTFITNTLTAAITANGSP